MVKKKTSISDIAKELGVSISTVSRALSDHPAISIRIKELVRSMAIELNYVPNSFAVNLKSGRKKSIGVIIPQIRRNFFSSAIEGIEDCAYSRGYDVIICQSKDSIDREKLLVSSLSGKVDGIIASLAISETTHTYYNQLELIGVPLVLFDRIEEGINASTVCVDDFGGAKAAVNHLITQGCKRIFHFAGPQHINVWRNRRLGWLSALVEAGITPENDWTYEAPTTREEGEKYCQRIIEMENRPDAIFFSGDYPALASIVGFSDAGINCPQDIAIVGFANEPLCDIIKPSLSSVEQFSTRMGTIACEMLFDRIEGKGKINSVITPELIIRESSLIKA